MTTAEPPHADAELRISTKAPQRPEAQRQRTAKNEALATSAAQMRERASQAAAEPAAPAEVPAAREDVESVEIELLDKRKVVLGPPPGISLTMRIAMTIPDATTNPVVDKLARLCMSVRLINGEKPRAITNIVDLTAVANTIGDVGIDELNFWYEKHWGTLRISDLQLLKKNLR